MRNYLRAAIMGVAFLSLPAVAHADGIKFEQFGPRQTEISGPVHGVTTGGVGFTLTGPAYYFIVGEQGYTFNGAFHNGSAVLQSFNRPGLVTIVFDQVLSSIENIGMQATMHGDYEATLTAFDVNGAILGTSSYSSFSDYAPGTQPFFNFVHDGIASIVLTTTQDDIGFALGWADDLGPYGPDLPPGGGVPESDVWAMLLLGVGTIGAALRHRRSTILDRATA